MELDPEIFEVIQDRREIQPPQTVEEEPGPQNEQEVQASPNDKLGDFLQKVNLQSHRLEISRIFSVHFPIEEIIESEHPVLQEHLQAYRDVAFADSCIFDSVRYVHVQDITVSDNAKQMVRRDLRKVPAEAKRTVNMCDVHGSSCSLVNYYHGFVIYLHTLIGDDEDAEDLKQTNQLPFEDVVKDVEEEVNLEEERRLTEGLDIQAIRRDSLLPVDVASHDEEEIGDVPVPVLPTFVLGGRKYVLVTDIQHLFDLREDHCLAAIAQNMEENEVFVDPDIDRKYIQLDSNVGETNFLPAKDVLSMMFNDATEYERSLPTEEEFAAAQRRLNIPNQPSIPDRPSSSGILENNRSIDLWKDDVLVSDENQKLVIHEDDFLKRGKGSRHPGLGKDSALGEYIRFLKFPDVVIYHSKFSEDGAVFPLLAIKVLSRYLAGYPVRFNADKVILLEKELAVEIFGQGPGVYALRSKYYLAYTRIALQAGIRDPGMLSEYGMKELLQTSRQFALLNIEADEHNQASSSK